MGPKMTLLWEDQGVRLYSTGRNYDFSHTVENDNDFPVKISLTGEYECMLDDTIVPAREWIGLFAGFTGDVMEAAFKDGAFVIECCDKKEEDAA